MNAEHGCAFVCVGGYVRFAVAQDYDPWFSSVKEIHPLGNAHEPKRRFQPSKWEARCCCLALRGKAAASPMLACAGWCLNRRRRSSRS